MPSSLNTRTQKEWEQELFAAILERQLADTSDKIIERLVPALDHANVNTVNEQGKTPLLEAIRLGQFDTINLLLAAGADVNHRFKAGIQTDNSELLPIEGSTPLMEVVRYLSQSRWIGGAVVIRLLMNGADISLTDAHGRTALDYLNDCNDPEIQLINHVRQWLDGSHASSVNAPLSVTPVKQEIAPARGDSTVMPLPEAQEERFTHQKDEPKSEQEHFSIEPSLNNPHQLPSVEPLHNTQSSDSEIKASKDVASPIEDSAIMPLPTVQKEGSGHGKDEQEHYATKPSLENPHQIPSTELLHDGQSIDPKIIAAKKEFNALVANVKEKIDPEILAAKTDFDALLFKLTKISSLLADKWGVDSNKYKQKIPLVNALETELVAQGKYLFLEPNKVRFNIFRTNCTRLINLALESHLTLHRSAWKQVHPILREILGVLAACTIIPALVVSAKSKHGFTGTFFEKNKPTKIETHLREAKEEIQKIETKIKP